ncbi:hypothetical protein POM88_047370 [Heracleum sosnowskyi]|uniref:Glyoxalase At5g48480-like N-terminal domain-containing protein n=1 Tax=Heracleum sosnowskyi TaxID=360622 RepID=A0AAD8GTC9_9APIA|nr:hypothetical protein POM88_047370 [Heracleum sosnowskyi]
MEAAKANDAVEFSKAAFGAEEINRNLYVIDMGLGSKKWKHMPYHGGPPQPYAIPACGAVHGPVGAVPHLPPQGSRAISWWSPLSLPGYVSNMGVQPNQSFGVGFSIGGMSQGIELREGEILIHTFEGY